eukprot:8006848-Pyramimonas_sp.AAC.2
MYHLNRLPCVELPLPPSGALALLGLVAPVTAGRINPVWASWFGKRVRRRWNVQEAEEGEGDEGKEQVERRVQVIKKAR